MGAAVCIPACCIGCALPLASSRSAMRLHRRLPLLILPLPLSSRLRCCVLPCAATAQCCCPPRDGDDSFPPGHQSFHGPGTYYEYRRGPFAPLHPHRAAATPPEPHFHFFCRSPVRTHGSRANRRLSSLPPSPQVLVPLGIVPGGRAGLWQRHLPHRQRARVQVRLSRRGCCSGLTQLLVSRRSPENRPAPCGFRRDVPPSARNNNSGVRIEELNPSAAESKTGLIEDKKSK